MVKILTAACRLTHRDPPLLEAVATQVLRGIPVYPVFALCNIANNFGRLEYSHQKLMDAIAAHLGDPKQAEQLSAIDIASLVFGYAQLVHTDGALLEACTARLEVCSDQITGPNCATILNSYARLSEPDPKLFSVIATALIETKAESFEVHHVTQAMNAFARCSVRKKQTMQILGGYLDGRVSEMSPQNVSNVIHAFAKVECYNHQLFRDMQMRLVTEDLARYKLFELAVLTHSLAKLKCGSQRIYRMLFGEFARRARDPGSVWETQTVVQILDAMRRRRAFYNEALAIDLMGLFLRDFDRYHVHPLTQAAWCLVELDTLESADQLPRELVQAIEEEGEPPARAIMRRVFERMESLSRERPLTATQQRYVQQLARAYRYRNEVDFGLLPQHCKAFCKALFDVPTTVVAAVARGSRGSSGHRRSIGQRAGGAPSQGVSFPEE